MNIELLDSDAASCSVTGNNCDFAHMTGCFLMKAYHCSVEIRDPFFDQMDTTLVSFMSVFWHSSADCNAIPAAQSEFDLLDFKI